jgi:asparagine synthase (glutamine-hydrolysing)
VAQPFFFPNLYISNKSFALASDNGVSLVMNGNDGDTVFSHGYEYLLELFFSLKWIKLYKEIHIISIVNSLSKKFIFKRVIFEKLSLRNFQNRSAQLQHLKNISTSNHSKAIEIQSLLANHYGIEERYPFYNRELIEYCLNISPFLKNKDGYSRYALREAIKGVVPEKIRKRKTKSNLGHALCLSFVKKDFQIIEEHLNNPEDIINEFIDIGDLRESWIKLKQNPKKYAGSSVVPSKLFSYVVLNRWLGIHRHKNLKIIS